MVWRFLSQYHDLGLLLLRAGLGVMMICHGWPKLVAGPAGWEKLGEAMSHLGITFLPMAWGFLAVVTETVGGAMFALGLFFRPAALLLAVTMSVATVMRFRVSGGEFLEWAWPAEMGIVFLAMLFVGPGRWSADRT
jgi:putative oxidoreductase